MQQQHQYQQPQPSRTASFAFVDSREIMQGPSVDHNMGRRSFHGEGMHQAAPMSRTPSLRPDDAGTRGYPSISPTTQLSYQPVGLVDGTNGTNAHRPSLTPIQHTWNSESSNPHSPHSSMEMMRSNSSSTGQIRHRPAPLNLQTGSNMPRAGSSNEHIQVEGSPFEPNFRSTSAMGSSPYGQAYQHHQANRLHSVPNISSPSIQTTQAGFYGGQQVSPYTYQLQHRQQIQQPPQSSPHPHAPQSVSGVSYPVPTQLPPLQHYVQSYSVRPAPPQFQQPYGMQQSSYLQSGQQPPMPPLPHMAHSAPSAIPQQNAATTAAYHDFQQQQHQRPSLLHNFTSTTNSSSMPDRPEYTGFSSYPANRGQERPHKCDQCTQSFNRNHDLKRHKRIHLEVKPFACSACRKQFSRRDALTRHWLVKKCVGFDSNPNNPAYTPPTGANRKNAAAIPRHYQNLSKKAQQAKVDRQKQQQDQQQRDQASNETSGSKDSDSASDRSKSEFDQEDESADQKSQGTQLGAQYSTLPSLPALSPPTPNIQVPTAPQYLSQAGPSLARSTSHSMVLVTPDESSVSIPPPKLTTKSNSSPFLTNHSQSVYSHLIPEKSMHPNGQYSNYESNSQSRHLAPQYSTQLATPSDVDSVRATIPSSGATSGQFAWQQQSGSYNTNSVASSVPIVATDRQLGQLHLGNSEGNMGSTESGVSQNNPYVNVSAASAAVSFAVPKPTRSSKDYFDGIVLSDKSAQPAMEVGSITASGDVSLDPALSSQNQGAVQRPVFTMPFGNSKAEQLSSESTTTETWQRWHRPSFPFPTGASGEMQQSSDPAHSDTNGGGFSQQSTLHHGMQQSQPYARSSLRLSHSSNNIMVAQQQQLNEATPQPPLSNAT